MNRRAAIRIAAAAAILGLLTWATFSNIHIGRDLSFFQPAALSETSQIAVEQVRHGPASRLILIALEDGPAPQLAGFSKSLTAELNASPAFLHAANGANELDERAVAFLVEHRYLLGPAPDPQEFTASALHQSLENALANLGTFSGLATADLLPRDPTGRTMALVDAWQGGFRPHFLHGVWFSSDDTTAVIVAETAATGDDEPAQGAAQAEIAATFDKLATGSGARLAMTGPPVFSRTISRSIQNEAYWIGAGASIAVLLLLYVTLRSPMLLIVIGFPAAAASIAGAAAVQLLFGSVHGIALTFGMTLIGVTSDYPVHLIAHLRGDRSSWSVRRSIAVPLLMSGTTAIVAFLPMTLSSFPGLAQLGLFAVTGIAAAMLTTWYLVPWVLDGYVPRGLGGMPPLAAGPARWIRLPLIALAAVSAAWMISGAATLFSDDLSRLNPLPRDLLDLDIRLRGDLGAPDVRRLVAVTGASAQAVLEKTEKLSLLLDRAIGDGMIAAYDSSSRYLPSLAEQERRQQALPEGAVLQSTLDRALQGLPFEPATFAPFVQDIAAAKNAMPLSPADVTPIPLIGDKLQSLLSERGGGQWLALTLLSGVTNPDKLQAEIGAMDDAAIHYLDLQAESVQIIAGYRQESLRWLAGGLLAVVLLLTATLKLRRALRVILSLGIALLLTAAILSLLDIALTPFHIAALLLVAGIGLDYALFMSHDSASSQDQRQVVKSLLICAATTILAFFFMIFSSAPILQGIGLTVTIGVTLALLSAMVICPPPGSGR
ncbi:MAG TPA: MMPL family transporter [Verrucomicrobiae bacterium]|nr:MMPL family transporter [Verrucomicrobiae bacterium]